jgi:hypothetical protein
MEFEVGGTVRDVDFDQVMIKLSPSMINFFIF